VDQSAVDLDLAFAGSSGADAADGAGVGGAAGSGDSLEVGPHASQARGSVLELGQFDLELGLSGLGAGGEDIEYELAAVDDLAVGDVFDLADLSGRQIVVEDDNVGVALVDGCGDLLGLASADVACRMDLGAPLDELADDAGSGGLGQGGQLGEGVGMVGVVVGQQQGHQEGAFPADGQVCSFKLGQNVPVVAPAGCPKRDPLRSCR